MISASDFPTISNVFYLDFRLFNYINSRPFSTVVVRKAVVRKPTEIFQRSSTQNQGDTSSDSSASLASLGREVQILKLRADADIGNW